HVQPGTGLTGKKGCTLNRFELGNDGTRLQKVTNASPALTCHAPPHRLDEFMVLRVDRDWQSQACSLAEAFPEREIVHTWKFGETGMTQEGLEAHHASLGEFCHLAEIARNNSAPHRKVGDRRGLERFAFCVEIAAIHSARN